MPSLRSLRPLGVLLVTLGVAGFGRCGGGDGRWKLTWSDEFDGPAGQAPDPAAWTPEVGTGWGNAQLEYDTARTENAALDGQGNLAIVARQESWAGSAYTSARLSTKGKVVQRHGRVEARIRLPVGQGIWPAFWMLGASYPQVGWPECGEIDIMEYRGQSPHVVLGSLHGPGYSAGDSITSSYVLEGPDGFDAGFHVFAIEWEDQLITWEVDGEVYHSASRASLPTGGRWVFDQPFYVILNVAVGGAFVGAPNGSTVFPQTMLVDYVRLFERE